ncbi:hypothetical protein LguiB_005677 [Lonicera macranthoides]
MCLLTELSITKLKIDQGVEEDPRIKVLKEWFEGKDCLDIGCNSSLITITIESTDNFDHQTSKRTTLINKITKIMDRLKFLARCRAGLVSKSRLCGLLDLNNNMLRSCNCATD